MVKVAFVSLGCAKNQVDLERLAGAMPGVGFEFVDSVEACNVAIINTCGFIKEAVSEAIDTILSIKKKLAANALLIVFGCMSERYKNEFAHELPEVDFFAGVGEDAMQSVLDYIVTKTGTETVDISAAQRFLFSPPYYAYLKISEGCDNRCTYCTIPSIRGNHRSFAVESIISDARNLAVQGVKEIIVISQDITKYGADLDGNLSLAHLLDILAEEFPNIFFRIMYLNPDGVTADIIDVVKKHENIIKYFDIPVQHGSDRILKLMNRHYDRSQINTVFEMIRSKLPEAFVRTTIITGFPGENDNDFDECISFLEECKPDFAGFFPYSPEEGTPAAKLPEAVDKKTISARLKKLQSLQKKNTLNKIKSFKKTEILCFVESRNEDFDFILEGRALFQAPEVDGQLYVIDGEAADGNGPYKAIIQKIVYPDIYVELTGKL